MPRKDFGKFYVEWGGGEAFVRSDVKDYTDEFGFTIYGSYKGGELGWVHDGCANIDMKEDLIDFIHAVAFWSIQVEDMAKDFPEELKCP